MCEGNLHLKQTIGVKLYTLQVVQFSTKIVNCKQVLHFW